MLSVVFATLARHAWYSVGAHLTEWGALLHMRRRRGCIYHFLYADNDLWMLRRAHQRTGNRLVASFHQPAADLRRLDVARRAAAHADAVILVSEAQRAYFEEFLPRERVFVVPIGVDSGFFRPAAPAADSPVGVTIGSHLRDFETLAAALRLIWEVEPGFRLVAVGTRSNNRERFPALDDPRVEFLDGVSDDRLLAACHRAAVALFCFRDATANTGVLEAMASGLPIVATRVGGVPEYVPPEAGQLCAPNDPQAIATATLRLLRDRELRARAAAAARARAEELDYRLVAAQTAAVYWRLLP